MNKSILLLENPNDLQYIDFKSLDISKTDIFSLNVNSHKELEKKNISHEMGDSLLSIIERDRIYEHVVSLHQWYNHFSSKTELQFEGINILGMVDTAEFHSYVIHRILKIQTIKKILEKTKPSTILCSLSLKSLISSLSSSKITFFGDETIPDKLEWDELNIILKLGSLSIPVKISNERYQIIKNFFENLTCNLFKLCHTQKNQNEIVLLVEMDPSLYSELISQLKNLNLEVVFLNHRRSAVWSRKAISSLKKNNAKLVKINNYLDSKKLLNIEEIQKNIIGEIEQLFNSDDISKIFIFDELLYWEHIKKLLLETFKKRIHDYILSISVAKSFFEQENVKCVLTLNEIGETEKSILNVKNNLKPSILLEHGFATYIPETSKFDSLSFYHLLRDKIAVWGEPQKQYLIQNKKILPENILTPGSIKHDAYSKNTPKKLKKKTLLFTSHPIMEVIGRGDTEMYLKLELFLKRLIETKNKFPDLDLIVKLHPSPDPHHNYISSFLKKLDPNITILHSTPILDLINQCDIMINVSEFYSPSTSILESIILEKPVIYVSLFENELPFDFIKQGAVLSLSSDDDLEDPLKMILFDDLFRTELIKNSQKFLKFYLSNFGNASSELAKTIHSL
jgi:hypothetical protein